MIYFQVNAPDLISCYSTKYKLNFPTIIASAIYLNSVQNLKLLKVYTCKCQVFFLKTHFKLRIHKLGPSKLFSQNSQWSAHTFTMKPIYCIPHTIVAKSYYIMNKDYYNGNCSKWKNWFLFLKWNQVIRLYLKIHLINYSLQNLNSMTLPIQPKTFGFYKYQMIDMLETELILWSNNHFTSLI